MPDQSRRLITVDLILDALKDAMRTCDSFGAPPAEVHAKEEGIMAATRSISQAFTTLYPPFAAVDFVEAVHEERLRQ